MSQRLVLIFATVSALSAGTNYAFSSWAPQLAGRLHLTSTQTNLVGASGNLGVYLSGPLLGILVDRRGPRIALIVAAVSLFIGYLGLYAMFSGGEEGMFAVWGVGGLAFAEAMTGIGSSAGLSGAVNGVSKSFSSKKRGSAMAIVVSGFGLSAFFYSTLSHVSVSSNDPTSAFLLLLAFGTGFSMLLGAIFVRPVLHLPPTRGRAGYLAIENPDASPMSRANSPSRNESLGADEVDSRESYFAEEGVESYHERRRREVSKERQSARDALDINGRELLGSVDFWLMFAFLGLCSGVGLMYLNNLGTITITLASLSAMEQREVVASQAHLVSLLSVCNCLGRLAAGFSSDYMTHHCPNHMRFARIWWYVPTAVLFTISQLVASHANSVEGWRGLGLPTALTGFAYGSLFAISPVICLERFGIRSFGLNNGLLTLAPSVFGNVANLAFGLVYDSKVDWSGHEGHSALRKRAGGAPIEHVCKLGPACFAQALQLTIIMSICAVAVAVTLGNRRTMKGAHV